MNFSDYFIKGLRNTLKLKNGVNFSFKGTELQIPQTTQIDQWFLGEFSSATYDIVAEYGVDNVERLTLTVTARVGQVTISDSGRTNLGRDLVYFTATADSNKVTVYANPYYQVDGVTPLVNVKITYRANYTEKIFPLKASTVTGPDVNLGGQTGIGITFNGTNLGDGFLQIDENGFIAVSNWTTVTVPTQQPLTAQFWSEGLQLKNTDGALTITTNLATNTVNFNLAFLKGLIVNQSITAPNLTSASLNNVTIGATTPQGGSFTTPVATGTVNLIPYNSSVTISPTGTGTVTINPAVAGNINNVNIGATNAKTARFTSLNVTVNAQSSLDVVNLATCWPYILRGAI